MPKKKSPNSRPAPVAAPVAQAVTQGNVFATFLQEAQSIGNEVTFRRTHDAAVAEYLKEKGLLEDCRAWLEAKQEKETPKPA